MNLVQASEVRRHQAGYCHDLTRHATEADRLRKVLLVECGIGVVAAAFLWRSFFFFFCRMAWDLDCHCSRSLFFSFFFVVVVNIVCCTCNSLLAFVKIFILSTCKSFIFSFYSFVCWFPFFFLLCCFVFYFNSHRKYKKKRKKNEKKPRNQTKQTNITIKWCPNQVASLKKKKKKKMELPTKTPYDL